MNKEAASKFINVLFLSRTIAHQMHLATDSYAKHKALESFYDEIVDLVDDLVEAYMGCYDKITTFPSVYHQPKEPVKYLDSLKK